MFTKNSPDGYNEPMPGIKIKTICHGEKTLMVEFILKAGSELPVHTHPHEQTGYLVMGNIRLNIDGKKHDVKTGDSWCIPGDVEHGAKILENSVAVEVFSPVREDLLP
ncbi:MAG: cupin [Desulfobacteraceae bacterium 4572_123]|nr:MAG: cupin [Desulfobacteraceae bacterium 4572_123]